MPYPTVVLDDAANADRQNQFRTYASQLPDPAQAQIDADLAAYQEHVASLGDVASPSSPGTSPDAVPPAASGSTRGIPAVGDVGGWRAWLTQQAGAAGKDPDFINAVLSGAYAESGLDPNRRQANGNGRGFFQFDTGGGMGTGLADAQLYDPAYQASKILPRYLDAWQRAPQGLSGADKAAWVAVQAERPDDSRGQASANYRAAYNKVVSNVGQSDQSGAGQAPAQGMVSSATGTGSISGQDAPPDPTGLRPGLSQSDSPMESQSQLLTPNDDLKAFSAYAQGLGDPGGTSTFGQNPEDATSPIDQARRAVPNSSNSSNSSGLPDFGGMARSALGSVGGVVGSMLPTSQISQKSQNSGFSLSDSGTGPTPYNDMAGSPGGFTAPVFGSNPQDASSLIERARAAGTGQGIGQAIGSALSGRVRYLSSLTEPDQPNTSGKILGGFSPEHLQAGHAEIGTAAMNAIGGIENAGAPLAKPLLEGAGSTIKAGVTRMFHGSQSVAPSIDPAKFLPGIEHESNWGPMFYASPNPDVANRFAPTPGQITATAGGAANVRAVHVPNDLKLFDADANRAALAKMYADAGGDRQAVVDQLVAQGYEGITSENAQQVGIFPHALPKVTNALSGAPEGAAIGRGGPPPSGPTGQIPTPENPNARAGNILLRKFVDPEVQQVIADAAAKDPQAMEAARRGVVSDATVQQLADAAGTTVGKVIARWKPGDVANAETITAMKTALDGKAREVIDAQKAIQSGDNATASLLRLQLATKEHQAIQEAVSGGTAELGRGLRALRQNVTQALQANDVTRMNDLLKKLGGAEWTQELANKLGELDTSNPTQVHTFLRDIAKAKAPDYINEWLYNAILSNPSTHIANSVSNTVNALMGPVERYAAGAIDAPLAAIQGRPRGRFFGEGTESAYGLLQGLPEGLRSGWYALQHGFSEAAAVKGEMPRAQAFKGPIGNAINTPSRLLTAADALMKPIVKRSALNAEIFRKAASEGLKGQALKDRIVELTANVPADLMERADKYAEYQLYRQEPKTLGKGLASIRGINIYGFEPLRFVLPFVQVPINATKYGLERSPLGFLSPDLWKAVIKKDPAAADMFTRAGLGSFFAAAIGAGVQTGKIDITGAAPTSPAQRDAFYRQGKLPFSIRIGDTWHSYQRVEPLNHSLTQVAAVVDALRNNKQGASLTNQATQAAFSIGQNIESQTFFTQINNLVNAMSDPGRYGAQFVASLETSMVPASSLMRATANTIDPRQRSPQGPVENIKSVTPFLSRDVPPNLNNYGEEQRVAGSPFLPYKAQTANDSPLETELARMKVEPGAPGKSIRGLDLTRQEDAEYQRLSGGLVKTVLTQLVNDPRYKQANDAQKALALQSVIARAKDAAARQYLTQLATSQGADAIMRRIQQKKLAALPKAG